MVGRCARHGPTELRLRLDPELVELAVSFTVAFDTAAYDISFGTANFRLAQQRVKLVGEVCMSRWPLLGAGHQQGNQDMAAHEHIEGCAGVPSSGTLHAGEGRPSVRSSNAALVFQILFLVWKVPP